MRAGVAASVLPVRSAAHRYEPDALGHGIVKHGRVDAGPGRHPHDEQIDAQSVKPLLQLAEFTASVVAHLDFSNAQLLTRGQNALRVSIRRRDAGCQHQNIEAGRIPDHLTAPILPLARNS